MEWGFDIRAAVKDDAPALSRLFNQASYRFGTLRMPYETAAEVEGNLFAGPGGNRLHLLAERDGVLLGAAGLWRNWGRRSHSALVGLGVDEAHQRRGVGHALMAALIDYADNWWGLRRLELTVNVDNAAAIALYERLGFEMEGRARQSILRDGVLVDAFHMARLRKAPGPDGIADIDASDTSRDTQRS